MNKGTELKGKIGHVNIIDTLEDNPQIKQDLQAKPEDIGKLLYEVYDVPSGICEHISKALLELKAIKEANPSEAFTTVYNNVDFLTSDIIFENDEVNACLITIKEQLPTIKQALLKAQELEKVLEIIFEKPLSLLVLKLFERSGISDLEYEFFVEGYKAVIEDINEDVKEQIVTEEEFDLLKRH